MNEAVMSQPPAETPRGCFNGEVHVVVFAPSGKDCSLISQVLANAGIESETATSLADVAATVDAGLDIALLAEEGLVDSGTSILAKSIMEQPAWSDFPVIVLTGTANSAAVAEYCARVGLGNVSLVERPVSPATLISAVRSALRARQRQLQLRDAMAENEQRNEERLRILGDNLPNGFVYQYTHEPSGKPRFLYVSAGVERINGVKPEDVLRDAGVLYRQFIAEEFAVMLEAERISARDLSVFEREMQMRLPDGQVRWMHIRARPRRLANGRTVWDGVQTDITKRKQAEQELRQSEARFRSLFENSRDAMFLSRADGTITAANPAACAMFGMTEEELRQRGRAGIADNDDPRLAPALEERLRVGRADAELQFVRKDGTTLTAEVSSVLLGGEPPQAFVVMRDITDRKRTEEVLMRSEKIAALGRMAATLAHDINNPLAAVMNTLFLAQTSPECSQQVRQYLEIADGELKRISHITQQALGFYRETAAPAIVTVSSILDEAIDLFKSKIKARQVRIEREYKHDVKITGVAGELRQVLSNLIANSLDAIEDRGTIRVHLSALSCLKSGSSCARITIADNGKGIGPAFKGRLFEPLFTTKGSIGTGLGLWVSKQLVEKHHGSINVRSSVNAGRRGTTFSIILPAAAVARRQYAS